MARARFGSTRAVLALAALTLAALPGSAGPAACASLQSGDLIVANVRGASVRLDRIDPGAWITTLSSGGLLVCPFDVCVASDGAVLVVDADNGVVRVDAATGQQSVFLGAAQLGGAQPLGIAAEPSGSLLATGWWRDGSHPAAVFRVTGADVSTLSSGGYRRSPTDVTRGTDGDLFVVEPNEPPGSYTAPARGSVVRIDPTTGAQKQRYVSTLFLSPTYIATLQDGSLAVAQYGAMRAGYGGAILRLDPATGTVTALVTRNASSGLATSEGGDLLYYSCIVTRQTGESYFTARFGASWGVSDVVGPMTVVRGARTVPVAPMSWGSLKARYR